MNLKHIKSYAELEKELTKEGDKFLLIYKNGADQSACALNAIQGLSREGLPELLAVDVADVRDVHLVFGISTAPSLLEFSNGALVNVYKGCQTESFYETLFSGERFSKTEMEEQSPAKRVIVYTTPACSWCRTLKMYLNENKVNYTEIDVASNFAKAEEMVRKSGQQGVPQTDINGNMIIGFDKIRIKQLLDIR